MALDITDVRDLIRLLRENPELRDAARAELVDEDMRALPLIVRRVAEAQERAEARLEAIDARIAQLVEAQARSEIRLDAIGGRLAELSLSDSRMESAFNKLTGRVDNFEGFRYEVEFDALTRIGHILRKPVRVRPADLDVIVDARDDGSLTPHEWEQLLALDGLYFGRIGRGPDASMVYVALEISRTIHTKDIDRAADRAALLRRCGLEVIAAAGGREISFNAEARAIERDVRIIKEIPDPVEKDEDEGPFT
jgi:uncharacterized coiled-coil protein SlyX